MLIDLRSDWTLGGTTYPKGSLLVGDADAYLRGEQSSPLFTPTATRSLGAYVTTQRKVL